MKTKLFLASALLFAASVSSVWAKYYLIGDFNQWNTGTMEEFSEEDGVCTLNKTFSGEFKIMGDNTTWFGSSDTDQNVGFKALNLLNNSVNLTSNDSKNLKLQPELNYTLTITNGVLKVSGFIPCITGTFTSNWANKVQMTKGDDGTYSYGPVQINVDDSFKLTDSPNSDANYYGANSSGNYWINLTSCYNMELKTPGDNFQFKKEGTYTIVLQTNNKVDAIPLISLNDDANNDFSDYINKKVNVEISGRTLKAGQWNTLCLPFALPVQGSILDNAGIKELGSSSFADGTLTLNFNSLAQGSTMTAGVPYLVYLDSKADDITDPEFKNVTISTSTAGNAQNNNVTFQGCFNPVPVTGDNYLYLGANNQLYFPGKNTVTIGAFRGYFVLPEAAKVKAINLNFGDETNSIQTISNETNAQNDGYYTIDGRHINGTPATAGIYIHNGRKIIIK